MYISRKRNIWPICYNENVLFNHAFGCSNNQPRARATDGEYFDDLEVLCLDAENIPRPIQIKIEDEYLDDIGFLCDDTEVPLPILVKEEVTNEQPRAERNNNCGNVVALAMEINNDIKLAQPLAKETVKPNKFTEMSNIVDNTNQREAAIDHCIDAISDCIPYEVIMCPNKYKISELWTHVLEHKVFPYYRQTSTADDNICTRNIRLNLTAKW